MSSAGFIQNLNVDTDKVLRDINVNSVVKFQRKQFTLILC